MKHGIIIEVEHHIKHREIKDVIKLTKKVITNARTKNALHNQFKQFLDGENISEQIEKKIEEHSIKKGIVKEVYPY
jgi:hypothetical protein